MTAINKAAVFHQTEVLLGRAAPLEQAGDWKSAIELWDEVYRQSIRARDAESLTEAILRMGHSYRQFGNSELAGDHLQLALTLSDLQGDEGRAGRALNGLAILSHIHGDLEDAECLYHAARKLAHNAGDILTAANIDQNLGSLANIRGNLEGALTFYQSSLALYSQIGNDRGRAGALNNLGMLHIDLTHLDKASSCLEEALLICRRSNEVTIEGVVHINRTELLLARGELDQARNSCDEAFEIVSRLGEHYHRSDALRFYGMIYRETNKPYLAETHLREAIEIASDHKHPLQEAEAQRELALVLRAQERNSEALEALNRSHILFNELRAKQDEADVNKRLARLEEDFLSLVRVWGESIEAKDRYTSGHCERVAAYACWLAQMVGIPDRDITWFRMGAFLHDVGKTEVPEAILNKPGRLTDEERRIIERHPIEGDEMLAPIPFPWDIRPMVRSHHERWDGHGYPDGLAREAIPYSARILRVADVFDALTTNRSYRSPLTPHQAIQLMEDDEGSFDPNLFEVFRASFDEFARELLVKHATLPAPTAI